jgi:hypothetical protein
MEFLIYDHECPVYNPYTFWDAAPWMCTVLSLYITVKFLIEIMNSSFDTYVEDTSTVIASLKDENETLQSENESLVAKRTELERELQHMNDVLNALVKKFVAEEHRLTKVD